MNRCHGVYDNVLNINLFLSHRLHQKLAPSFDSTAPFNVLEMKSSRTKSWLKSKRTEISKIKIKWKWTQKTSIHRHLNIWNGVLENETVTVTPLSLQGIICVAFQKFHYTVLSVEHTHTLTTKWRYKSGDGNESKNRNKKIWRVKVWEVPANEYNV